MSKLTQWLDHRMEVVGLNRWKDLSDYSGVSSSAIREMNVCGSLAVLSRSERRLLAAGLRVALRRLEQLDDGQIDWIEDAHRYDAATPGRLISVGESDLAYWAPRPSAADERGTPVIGTIGSGGRAEPDEQSQEDRRLPTRFGSGQDVYALQFEGSRESLVFHNIPIWEFRGGPGAVYSWNGCEARGWVGQVFLAPDKVTVVTPDGLDHVLDPLSIVRIAKVIGSWPQTRVSESGAGQPTLSVVSPLPGRGRARKRYASGTG